MKTIDVLAIDSNNAEAETVKDMLGTSGEGEYSFSHVRRSDEGLATLDRNRSDVLLLDLSESLDSVVAVRNRFPDIAVILLADANDERRAKDALAYGADDYLVKGQFSPELLARTIRSSLERKRLEQEIGVLRRDRDRLQQEVRRMENTDPVTGLPNMRLLRDRLDLERERARRQKKKLAVLSVGIEGFRALKAGNRPGTVDDLLPETASRLRSHLRKSDTVARVGDDEFQVILPDIARPHDVADVARTIMDAFRTPLAQDSFIAEIAVGIGIYPDDSDDADALLRFAAEARRDAKAGKDEYRFYNASVNMRSRERIRLRDLLRSGIAGGQIEIVYQPLVDSATRRIVCAEALARWRHPERGLLGPDDFIPAAEESGLIKAVDERVFRAVCTQTRAWLDAGLRQACVTVNLSSRQLHDPSLARTFSKILNEAGLAAGYLYLEVTEKSVMSNGEAATERLRELAGMGFHISIDDFGTGYTSVHQLERLPLERIKIDRQFVRRVPADPDSRTIVRSVTSLAHNMRLKAVAEGVETEDQFTFLRATGCDEMQGYLFSRPLPAAELEKLMMKR